MEMSELEGIKRKRLRGGHNVKDSDFLLFFFGGGRGGGGGSHGSHGKRREDNLSPAEYKGGLRIYLVVWKHKPATPNGTQEVATMKYVRFKVTLDLDLYLSPDNRARNLPTLMAAIVNRGTEHDE